VWKWRLSAFLEPVPQQYWLWLCQTQRLSAINTDFSIKPFQRAVSHLHSLNGLRGTSAAIGDFRASQRWTQIRTNINQASVETNGFHEFEFHTFWTVLLRYFIIISLNIYFCKKQINYWKN
jgi:hypothetical protein